MSLLADSLVYRGHNIRDCIVDAGFKRAGCLATGRTDMLRDAPRGGLRFGLVEFMKSFCCIFILGRGFGDAIVQSEGYLARLESFAACKFHSTASTKGNFNLPRLAVFCLHFSEPDLTDC